MVTYLDPFIPLSEQYPYSIISKSPDALCQLQDNKHKIEIGWLKCPCTPTLEDNKAWKLEVYRYKRDDIINDILFLHQTAIMVTMWQTGPGASAFLGQILDSARRLHKTAMNVFNLFLTNSVIEYFNAPYQVVTRKEENEYGHKIKKYYLYHIYSQEEWEFKDGICIEPVDRFLDWLDM